MIRNRIIMLVAVLALAAPAVIASPAVAGPADEEYRLDYPNARGESGGGKDSIVVGPKGASAQGIDAESGKGGGGAEDDASGGDSKKSSLGAAATATSDTVPEIAADNASAGTGSNGVAVLILILAGVTAAAFGYAAWRRNRTS